MNQITILGNLTRDPEAGTMPDGTATARFGLAENLKIKGEDVPQFYRVNAIGRQADFANQYLAKGRQVLVLGQLQLQTFTRNDGTPGNSLEVRATTVQAVGAKPQTDEAPVEAAAPDKDVPF
jgi:single-strand DNA-binding protein